MHFMLTPEDVAKITKLPVRSVRRLVLKGLLPGRKVGHLVRVPSDQFERWLSEVCPASNDQRSQEKNY